jgi:ubiquinone/menaquinone biosynthesis C-methylase UbiE
MDYDIRRDYQNVESAKRYNRQFASSPRARLTTWGEQQAFTRTLKPIAAKRSLHDMTVLDIACGTGRFTSILLHHGMKVTGSDVSAQMLAEAREALNEHSNLVDLVHGDATALPFADREFEGVTCIRLYQRVPSSVRLEMLKEVRRVGQGWAILFFAMSSPWLDLRRSIRSRLLPHHPVISHPLTMDQLRHELNEAGLTLQSRRWTVPFLSDGMVVLVKW